MSSGDDKNDKKKGLGALAALRDSLPPGTPPPPPGAIVPMPKPGPARAVVRMERKGRGGKEATIIEKLDLKPAELETWCKDLKAAMGCGGAVDEDNAAIVLQGDLRARLEPVLLKRGVRKVTIG